MPFVIEQEARKTKKVKRYKGKGGEGTREKFYLHFLLNENSTV
jgi:hypothetical protein